MSLSESGFVTFALGIASATGVILAVSVPMFVMIFNRIHTSEQSAFERFRAAAKQLYAAAVNPHQEWLFEHMPDLQAFQKQVAKCTVVQYPDDLPDYFAWRSEMTPHVQYLAGFKWAGTSLAEFVEREPTQRQVTDNLLELDNAIQREQTSRSDRERVLPVFRAIAFVGSCLLIGSITAALFGSTASSMNVAESWNWYGASAMLGVFVLLVALIVILFFGISLPGKGSILRLVQRRIGRAAYDAAAERVGHAGGKSSPKPDEPSNLPDAPQEQQQQVT